MDIFERIWYFTTIACVIWYLTITIVVAFRASKDIKSMLGRMGDKLPNGKSDA